MNRPYRNIAARRSRQGGMALLIALVVLVVVTVLGMVSMRTALFQNRVSINNQMTTQAFQAAESGLATALSLGIAQTTVGANNIPNDGDEFQPGDSRHLFIDAVIHSTEPRRVCMTEDGAELSENDGVRNADGSIGFETPCDPLPGSNVQVTTMVSAPAPDDQAGKNTIQGTDIAAGGYIDVELLAQGEVVGTNVRSVHQEIWSTEGPSDTGMDGI